MADINKYKTTDLDVVERGSGNGEKDGPPAGMQVVGEHQPSGLEASTMRLQCWESSANDNSALHQSSSCCELWRHHSSVLGIVRR